MSDFQIDDYKLLKYLRGQATQSEKELIVRWLGESEENRKTYYHLKALWFAMKAESYSENASMEQSLAVLIKRLDQSQTRFKTVIRFTRYLAVILIAIGTPLLLWFRHHNKTENAVILANNSGQVKTVSLGKNSDVWINSNSSLSYSAALKKKRHTVEIRGEALFKIADTTSGYLIKCASVTLRPGICSFNIRSLPGSDTVEVTVVSGSLSLFIGNNSQQKTITEGEQAICYIRSGDFIIRKVDPEEIIKWYKYSLNINSVRPGKTIVSKLTNYEKNFFNIFSTLTPDMHSVLIC